MLRRQSWFIPASTSSSVRPGQRDPEDVLRLARRRSRPRRPAGASRARSAARPRGHRCGERSVGGRSPRRRTPSSAMPALTVAASQRRVTTGGPIGSRTPLALEVRGHRAEPGAEVLVGPVQVGALGQVGEERLRRAAAGRARARRRRAGRRRRSRSTRAATGLHPPPGRRLQEADRAASPDEVQVIARTDGADGGTGTGHRPRLPNGRGALAPPGTLPHKFTAIRCIWVGSSDSYRRDPIERQARTAGAATSERARGSGPPAGGGPERDVHARSWSGRRRPTASTDGSPATRPGSTTSWV